MSTTTEGIRRNGDGLTVFERAAARVKAVEETDKLIARQKEQIKEIAAQVTQMKALRHQWQAALLDNTDTLRDAVHKYEAQLISVALEQANGSVTRAAVLLGISHQALYYNLDNNHKALRPLIRSDKQNRKKCAK